MPKLGVDLLRALKSAGQFGLAPDELLADMRQGRHRSVTLPELEHALRDLADQSFATTFTSALRAKRWRITSLGGSALEEEGL